jgi:hypothetical protein
VRFTTEQLEAMAKKLRSLPAIEKNKQEHGRQDSIKFLSKEIESLQKRGYTLEQISASLNGFGFDVATPTLKVYLKRAKGIQETKTNRKKETIKLPTGTIVTVKSEPSANTKSGAFTPIPDSAEI